MNTTDMKTTILRIADAYRSLEQAKQDFKDVVESEIDLMDGPTKCLSGHEKRNIKKLAKAVADEKIDDVTEESIGLTALCTLFEGLSSAEFDA